MTAGDGAHHMRRLEGQAAKGPEAANLDKIHAENRERTQEVARVEKPTPPDVSVRALEGALSAFANAHPDAQKQFLSCYADQTHDPMLQKTLNLMTGRTTLAELLNTKTEQA